ncbi:hypothetical protein AU255_06845 [Methyloprofundus sedimenti]|uniref:Helicase n=1 Tax=Methyloprofundus sedimenti TaxID=1420851 RepID=A0A1V8M7S9_9GAMM|nr:DEAD/DEAH box helicase [Methyloprofundus sedimenti]OQK17582.1 hypothetical protein AU255_06845 [Methyloprofundus sedimenti]
MATFSNFLSSFDPEKKGIQFEHFVKWFLKNDPEWSTQIDQVWLWDEYPDRWGRDCGIDLVFKHKNNDIWAVQAKCYSPEYSISKSDVDKFLSESNRTGIDKRLLIATTDQMGQNAKQVCHAQEKTVTHFFLSDFDQAAIEYPEHISALNTAKRKSRPIPRPHQIEAIDAVEKGFKNNGRGQLIMACGTGKTYTTLWIKERQAAVSTLVLLPSLGLLSQSLREWTYAANTPFDVLCICSDQTVGKQSSEDDIIHSVKDLSFPVTSDMHIISQFLKGSGNKVIFSTYQSSPIIADAQRDNNIPEFDLVIADEAHRCTGKAGSDFTTILDQSRIRANKRLFTTATPKTYSANLKKKASEMGVDVTGMDDESVFGKVLYALTFGEAIKRKLLTDYQMVLVGVDNPMIAQWIQQSKLVKTEAGDTQDAKSLASQIGLIKAIKDYDLKRMISFHSRVNRAETFASEIQNSIDLIEEEYRPDGKIWADFVSGKMTTHKRRLKLDQLKSLTISERGLLSNARCLSEGVDVPSLDGVAFIDPRSSHVDIIQAVGRAIRLSDDKTIGTIIVPVFIEDGDNIESSMQSSHFKPVWEVLNALKSHDEVLAYELDEFRTNLGRGSNLANSEKSFSKIAFDLPTTIDESFSESLKTYLVEKTTSSWHFWFGLLEVFVEQEGHARVPSKYKTADGFKLGNWLSNQKAKKKSLTDEQLSRLESLEGWVWDVSAFQWEEGFSRLEQYVQQKGYARVPSNYKTSDGYKLGGWVNNQKTVRKSLTNEQLSRLESLEGWAWDVSAFQWEEGFSRLEQYVQQKGHARVSKEYKTVDGYKLGQWVSTQKQNKTQLTAERITKLKSLEGWVWDLLEFQWEQGFSYIKKYAQEHGHTRVSGDYKTADGFNLGNWVTNQRAKMGQLTPERLSRLESLDGWVWGVSAFQWEQGFNYLKLYTLQKGHARVLWNYKTSDGYNLGQWVNMQRRNRHQLSSKQISLLEALDDWVWGLFDLKWEQGFSYLEEYILHEGHARVSGDYKTADGFNLGNWVTNQRVKRRQLTPERLSRLESLDGWVWSLLEFNWEQGFAYLEEYTCSGLIILY